jgi:hypothetical protein
MLVLSMNKQIPHWFKRYGDQNKFRQTIMPKIFSLDNFMFKEYSTKEDDRMQVYDRLRTVGLESNI